VPHTLLLADDSVTIQRVIELTFADEDVRVVAVGDGSEAIAILDRNPPDIVLADVGMPGENGYAVARHIRDTPRLSHIPIVLLTGAFEPIDQAKVAEVGCDGVLAKPFEPQLVIARVKELLARPKDPAESTARSPVADEIMRAPLAAENVPRREEIDSYFDRLDKAFTNLSGNASAEVRGSSFAPGPAASEPMGLVSPVIGDVGDVGDVGTEGTTGASRPAVHPPQVALPPLAEAFAALLTAEQASPAPSAAPAWPGSAAPVAPGPAPAIAADLVEQITRRVLEQLTDRAVRETTAEIVSRVAERLVKEEIQRLKDSIPE
jgi:CheY-like chemotaxis protein